MFRITIKKLIILALIILDAIVIGMMIFSYWTKTVNVRFNEIALVHTNEELTGTWWTTISDENSSIEKKYSIKLPKVDYKKKCLIISGGRELKQLTYTRKSKYSLPYKEHPYVGNAILRGKLHPNTIFVYETNKINLVYDDINWPSVKIEP